MYTRLIAKQPGTNKKFYVIRELTSEIKPGEQYVAKRNTGWWLLTCKSHDPNGYYICEELAYYYDTYECFKVREVIPLEQFSDPQLFGIDCYDSLIKTLKNFMLSKKLPVEISNLLQMDLDSIKCLMEIASK